MTRLSATDHATHDLELVASYASGDAIGPDLDAATALVARCPECAALHHDLRAIALALPTTSVPVRTRDFRLTPEQAASLRARGWRRLAAALAGPGFRFAAPLGTGLATLGITGLLLGTLAGSPLLGATTTAGAAGAAPNAALDSNAGAPPEKSASSAYAVLASAASSAAPSPAASIVDQLATNPEATRQAASPVPGALALQTAAPVPAGGPSGGDTLRDVQPAAGSPLVPLAALALILGLALVGVRLAGRRLARGA